MRLLAMLGAALAMAGPASADGPVYPVPDGITADCSAPVDKDLAAWFATIPNPADGTRAVLNLSGCYLTTGELTLTGKRFLIDGQGVTELRWQPPLDDGLRQFRIVGGNVSFTRMTLRGGYTYPTSGDGHVPVAHLQHMHAIDFNGAGGGVANMDISGYRGDGVYFGLRAGVFSTGSVTDSRINQIGRNAVSVVAGVDVQVSRNVFHRCGYWCVDIEPNRGAGGASRIAVTDNVFGTQGGTTVRPGFGIVALEPVRDVQFLRNRFVSRPVLIRVNPSNVTSAATERLRIEDTSCQGAGVEDVFISRARDVTLLRNQWPGAPTFSSVKKLSADSQSRKATACGVAP
jgi:opacity protein-like surface antigen